MVFDVLLLVVGRASKYVITGKLDLGVVTSISSRFTYLINDTLSLRVIGRCGTSGVDAELGLSRRFSPSNTLYAGVGCVSAARADGGLLTPGLDGHLRRFATPCCILWCCTCVGVGSWVGHLGCTTVVGHHSAAAVHERFAFQQPRTPAVTCLQGQV